MLSRRCIAICLTFAIAGLIIACGTLLYIPTENQVTLGVSLKELQDGRAAYINNCGGCHTLVVPEKYSPKEWGKWVDKMEPKVKIKPLEKELILKYLTAAK